MIVVCGEALIDVIRAGDGTQKAAPGGGPFNTARALARLGVPTAFLGRLSTDASGRELKDLLAADGVGLELAVFGPEPTTTAVAEVDASGTASYRFEVEGTSAPNLTPAMLPAQLEPEVEAVHLGSLALALEPMASTLPGFVRRERHGRLVMLDPNVRRGLAPEEEYRARLREVISLSTIVKASDADLEWLYPGLGYQAAAVALLAGGVRLVVVTLGARGAFAAHAEHRARVDAVRVDVVDTIGAGDAFGAALLAWLHENDLMRPDFEVGPEQLRSALEFACLAAALTCARAGADPPWRMDVVPASR